MPYVTFFQSPQYNQFTFEEILNGIDTPKAVIVRKNETNTRTMFKKELPEEFLKKYSFVHMKLRLKAFLVKWEHLYEKDRRTLYDTFYIPKKSGGLREINAPVPELMEALRELKDVFEKDFFALYHTSAFAYIPGRSTIDAMKRHQQNESNWFLKTDLSNFFGSTTPDFLFRMLSMIFPFSEVVKTTDGELSLRKALNLCFLDGGLPQGTPISPLLTNIMMIPIDHRISNCLRSYKGNSYVYTRYADDSIISSKFKFDQDEIVGFINETLRDFKAPFKIKEEKTRFGSRSGSNWNLGLMLNKDNEITIGHKNKQRFRAMINNYILDRAHGKRWELHDVQVLRGLINYYSMVEREYIAGVLAFNNEKYHTNVLASIKADLNC